jgi:hypothetical protein
MSCGETCLLASWCAGDRCDMAGSDKDQGRNRRFGAKDQGWLSTGRILGGRTIKKSDDAVCGPHRARGDEEREFLDSAPKSRSTVSPGLTPKSVATGFLVWPQNQGRQVFCFGTENR